MDGAMSDTSMVQRSNIDDENEKLRAVGRSRAAAQTASERLLSIHRETRISMNIFVSGSNPL